MRTATISIIIAILVGLVVLAYIRVMMIWENLKFVFSFQGVDLSQFNLSDIAILGGETNAKLRLAVTITNNNTFSISFNNMRAYLYHNKVLIAETSNELADKSFDLQPKSSLAISDNVNVHINSASINLIKGKIAGGQQNIDYTIKVRIWGLPYSHSDSFTW